MTKEMIAQGAEAKIYADADKIRKERFSKSYRHPVIDEALRKQRTRREAKVLEKAQLIGLTAPELIEMNDKDMLIDMRLIDGDKLRDVLYKDPLNLGRDVGAKLGLMHSNGIIHGDLTTSNMILAKNGELNFIDFGLSFFSQKEEDKAVDLHLLKQALESKHYLIWEKVFKEALEGYKDSYPEFELVFDRLDQVEQRGRNKSKTS